jgi:hypothetical protein
MSETNTLGGGYTRFLDDDKQNFWGGLSNIEVAPPSIDTGPFALNANQPIGLSNIEVAPPSIGTGPFALNANQPIGLGNTFGMQRQLAGGDTGGFWGSLTGDKMKGAGSILGGVGNLASAWAAIKGLGLVKDQMAQQQGQWNKNYEAGRITTNNQIAAINDYRKTQGLAPQQYVGDWKTLKNIG